MSAQKENLMADLPADVDQLKDHLVSVLQLNAGLQNQVHRLELHIQQMRLTGASQQLTHLIEELGTRNEELVAENNRLEEILENFDFMAISTMGAFYAILLQRFEALALQHERLKEKVVDQRTLIRALLCAQASQRIRHANDSQGIGSTNSGLPTHCTSGRFKPAL
ncbi:hypothetical protein GYMLUDRAFT_60175 [Collybiopsis luxurians FD-317 M1]|uniref:Uncharacterized protein n=1 Tax=Collybiopsis luxurians FD-317 M1 TaxID=944289 RepID=A0A0D0CTV4_9AGAR|nr:hypothetical protein GYMLUDRAFT_60175 [Collybiopsis luxurians FD-317 M1]